MAETVDIRRAPDRFHTTLDWLDAWHSFSFNTWYDPNNIGHGLLIVNNDDVIAPASGFGTHSHRDMEIVTWVLEGELAHKDSSGGEGIIYPGLAQRMSAGTGISHSEMNPSPDVPTHSVQMWVLPDTQGIEPGYEQHDVNDQLAEGELVAVASGTGDGGVRIHQRDATLWAARPRSDATLKVPDAPRVHVFVTKGSMSVDGSGESIELNGGDAVRLSDAGELELTATSDDSEVLIWETAA